jgi:hypothetical protein
MGEGNKMKKLLMTVVLLTLMTGMTFAGGITEYELAELLVTKGVAEELIVKSTYPVDIVVTELTKEELRVISTAKYYGLYEVVDLDAEAPILDVRKAFSRYSDLKENGQLENFETKVLDPNDTVSLDLETKKIESTSEEPQENKYVFDYSNYLSDELVEDMYVNEDDYDLFGGFRQDMNEKFDYPYYDDNPEFNEYRRQITWILAKYAIEHELFVGHDNAGVGLYESKWTYDRGKGTPLFKVDFSDGGDITDGYEGCYHIGVELNYLHTQKTFYQKGDDIKEARKRLEEANFRTDYAVEAFKETLSWLFNDYDKRDKVYESMTGQMDANRDKEYSYWDFEVIRLEDMRILKILGNGEVTYRFEYKDVFK